MPAVAVARPRAWYGSVVQSRYSPLIVWAVLMLVGVVLMVVSG
ncbi:MAG TPA: hypothetical protein VGS19_14625 [Streptosporangiaceae bacterium]|nr:hypothetical protein [Streptosporangiaceae bacterium]